MSYESFTRSLRDDVMAGARKRRRFEKRRRVVLAATPVVLLLAIVGGLVASDREDASEVHTEVPPTTTPLNLVFADQLCAVVDSLADDPADGDIDDIARRDALLGEVAELSTRVGDQALAEASRAIASADLGSDEFLQAQVALTARCEQLGRFPTSSVPPTSAAPGVLTDEAIAACDAAIDLRDIMGRQDDDESDVYRTMVEAAMSSGDDTLEQTGRAQIPVGESDWQPGDPLLRRSSATADIGNRCRELQAPGWITQIILAPLGPEPRVDLADYGTVTPLSDEEPTRADIEIYERTAIGRDLSPIEARIDGRGGVIVNWAYAGITGPSGCEGIGTRETSYGSTCGTLPFEAPAQHRNLATDGLVVAVQFLDDDVAFVVLDVGGTRFVQRPSIGMALLRPEIQGEYQVRLYDVDGNQLACSPSFGSTFAPTC